MEDNKNTEIATPYKKILDTLAPYKPGKPIADVKRELGLETVYKLASNENPLGPPEASVKAMSMALNNVSQYCDANAYELRMALAEKHGVDPEEIVFGDGSNELIKLLALCLLEDGDEVIVPKPSFGEYIRTTVICDGNVKIVPLTDDFVVDLPAMTAAISSRTKMVYICNPNNPTGTVCDKKLLKQMLNRMKDVVVVMDEAYYEFVSDPDSPDGVELFKEYPNIIALRTFSKAYGLAGLRVGYGVCNKKLAAAINVVREPFNVNSLAQVAALAALGDNDYLEKSVKHNTVEREFLMTELKNRGFRVVPSQTNFMFFDCMRNSVEVFKDLLKKGIIVRSGDIFGYDNYIRLSVGLRKENEAFLKAFDEVMGL